MTIEEMLARKRELGLSNQEISRRSGVPLGTLQKIFSGKTVSPRRRTIEALEHILSPVNGMRYDSSESASFLIRESPQAYAAKGQGEYTLDDYYALPDERRVELIDGVIYDMAAPSVIHQKILALLFLQFESCAAGHEGNCEVFLSPCDVQLDNDNRTMLQPDLFVLCRPYDLKARCITGAPDLVVEILSAATRSRDMLLKLSKYQHAGVREYWMVDPKNRSVYVYDFTDPDFHPEVYPFVSVIPVHISRGSCSIDFAYIDRRVAQYYKN